MVVNKYVDTVYNSVGKVNQNSCPQDRLLFSFVLLRLDSTQEEVWHHVGPICKSVKAAKTQLNKLFFLFSTKLTV